MKLQFTILLFLIVDPAFPQKVLWPTTLGKYFSSNFGENRDDHFHMGVDIKTNGKIKNSIIL